MSRQGNVGRQCHSTIAIFEKVSPSVVQVAARPAASNPLLEDQRRMASGTGFIWDEAGYVVTNDHVVQGTGMVAVRLASGDVVQAERICAAPNYDLGVIRIRSATRLRRQHRLVAAGRIDFGRSAFATAGPACRCWRSHARDVAIAFSSGEPPKSTLPGIIACSRR